MTTPKRYLDMNSDGTDAMETDDLVEELSRSAKKIKHSPTETMNLTNIVFDISEETINTLFLSGFQRKCTKILDYCLASKKPLYLTDKIIEIIKFHPTENSFELLSWLKGKNNISLKCRIPSFLLPAAETQRYSLMVGFLFHTVKSSVLLEKYGYYKNGCAICGTDSNNEDTFAHVLDKNKYLIRICRQGCNSY